MGLVQQNVPQGVGGIVGNPSDLNLPYSDITSSQYNRSGSVGSDLYGTSPSGSNFVLDNLACSGSETSVFHCPTTGESNGNCEASQIAGTKCATSKL